MNNISDILTRKQRIKMILEELSKSEKIIKKKQLADMFYVTERTITRDMKKIVKDNSYIKVISGRNGGYKILKRNDEY